VAMGIYGTRINEIDFTGFMGTRINEIDFNGFMKRILPDL
jgi:hypothetical protein